MECHASADRNMSGSNVPRDAVVTSVGCHASNPHRSSASKYRSAHTAGRRAAAAPFGSAPMSARASWSCALASHARSNTHDASAVRCASTTAEGEAPRSPVAVVVVVLLLLVAAAAADGDGDEGTGGRFAAAAAPLTTA